MTLLPTAGKPSPPVRGDELVGRGGEMHGLVALDLGFLAGTRPEREDAGATSLAFALTRRGTQRRTELEFDRALRQHALTIGPEVYRHSTRVRIECLAEELDRALALALEALCVPADTPEALAALVARIDESTSQWLHQASTVAAIQRPQATWPSGGGAPRNGHARTRATLDPQILRAHRRRVLSAPMVTGVACTDAPSVLRKLSAFQQELRERYPVTLDAITSVPAPEFGRIDVVDTPCGEHAAIALSYPAPPFEDPLWPAFMLLHDTLASSGGGLWEALRPLSYGVDCDVHARREWSVGLLDCEPAGEHVLQTLATAKAAWREHGPGLLVPAALELAKEGWCRRYRMSLVSPWDHMASVVEDRVSGLAADASVELYDRVRAIEPAQVEAALELGLGGDAFAGAVALEGGLDALGPMPEAFSGIDWRSVPAETLR